MKLAVLVVLLAVGCGSKSEPKEEPAAGSAADRASVTDPLGFCERARRLMLGRRKCFPEDTSLKMGLDEIAGIVAGAPADAASRRRVAVQCALMVDGMMRASQPANCPLDVTDDERTELTAFLAGWYGERTAPPATGNAEIDATLVKVGTQRDVACACKDMACVREALRVAETDLGLALPAEAPAAATEAKAKMLDEITRCKQKLSRGF